MPFFSRKPVLTDEQREGVADGLIALARCRGTNLEIAARDTDIPRRLATALLMALHGEWSAVLENKVTREEVAFLGQLLPSGGRRARRELATVIGQLIKQGQLKPAYTMLDSFEPGAGFVPIHAIVAAE